MWLRSEGLVVCFVQRKGWRLESGLEEFLTFLTCNFQSSQIMQIGYHLFPLCNFQFSPFGWIDSHPPHSFLAKQDHPFSSHISPLPYPSPPLSSFPAKAASQSFHLSSYIQSNEHKSCHFSSCRERKNGAVNNNYVREKKSTNKLSDFLCLKKISFLIKSRLLSSLFLCKLLYAFELWRLGEGWTLIV